MMLPFPTSFELFDQPGTGILEADNHPTQPLHVRYQGVRWKAKPYYSQLPSLDPEQSVWVLGREGNTLLIAAEKRHLPHRSKPFKRPLFSSRYFTSLPINQP